MDDIGWLFGRLYRLDRSAESPPWPLDVWDDATSAWQAVGIVGAAGATGATGATGPAGLTWQGAWSNSTAYAVHDAVQDAGSAYVCISAHTGHEPPNATYWQLLASKGDTGATGATGATGGSGSDSLWHDVYTYLAAHYNDDPLDTKIIGSSGLIALVYMRSLNGVGGTGTAVNAVHTVATGKTLKVLEVRFAGASGDTTNRTADLYNSTDSVIIQSSNAGWGSSLFLYQGDSGPGAFKTVAAGKTVKARTTDINTIGRSIGAVWILLES